MKYIKVEFEPAFIEEVVFLNMKERSGYADDPLVAFFHREREGIYSKNLVAQEHEKVFQNLYETYFTKIGLRAIFESVFSEFPLIDRPDIIIFIKKVWRKKEEEAELYARGNLKTVAIGVQAASSLNRLFLEAFLRHELMHVSDMLDPVFSYSPNPLLGGINEMEDNLIRDRFRLLWDLYIDFRLRKRSFTAVIAEEKRIKEIEDVFSFCDREKRVELLEGILSGRQLTQATLLAFAQNNKATKSFADDGRLCPLCEFPSYDYIEGFSEELTSVVGEICKDYPSWQMSAGLCIQCFEIYRSRIKIGI